MSKLLTDTKTNLLAGVHLAFFRSSEIERFAINADQLVGLLVLDLLLNIVLGFFLALPDPVFDAYALPVYSLNQSIFFLIAFMVAKFWRNPELFLTMGVMTLSLTPVMSVLIYWDGYLQGGADEPDSDYPWLGGLIALYSLVVLGRVFYIASGRLKALATVTLLSLIITGALQFHYYGDYQKFWYLAEDEEGQKDERWSEYQKMDAEGLMYRQPEILTAALQTLKPQREQKSELFFVGFAGYATEDVFFNEVTFAKNMLDSRFDTQGHSINLINHLSTRDTQPLANATNLAATLKRIGALMDKDDDVLVIYLTSHGSEDHALSVSFWPLQLNDITPEKLRAMLDEAGIKWRVIIVSACYSGGFVKALENNQTLVATAAAADKTSFGCGTESEFTYFGEALFKDQLPHEYSLVSALQQTNIIIGQREKRENIEASFPQLSIGKSIKTKLENLGEEIRLRQCAPKGNNVSC